MIAKHSLRTVLPLFFTLAAAASLPAQIVIDGVTDRTVYTDAASFRVQTNTGFAYEVTLNGVALPAGVFHTVAVMDYYDLAVRRTQLSDSAVTTALVRFIVQSSRRGDPERGLIEWFPLPPIPSTAAELAGVRLHLMTPEQYPAGLEIPVVVRAEDAASGGPRRVNGWVNSVGVSAPAFRLLRGEGHGFLPAATPGSIGYEAHLPGVSTNKTIVIEPTTTWTTVSGILGASTTWPANSRIHVTGNLTIPAGGTLTIGAGTVVRLNPGVNLTNSGRTQIDGEILRPVIFTPTNRVAPEQHAGAWGGWLMRGSSAQLFATATIMTGAGAATGFDFSPATSHKSDQPLLLVHSGATVRMTNCALINQAGQIGNGYFSTVTFDHCLIQRAVTCGEWEECTNVFFRSAVIEFPAVDGVYNATIADADYDAYYAIRGTNYMAQSLFGFAKDDAIDSGSGGAGRVLVTNCWIESALHEALAWSGDGRVTWTYDSVLINCGQGLECGWSGGGGNSPLCFGGRILSTANSVGTRYGDNYSGTSGLGFKDGFLTVSNSLLLHNYRDVWGQVWDDTWNYRVGKMDIRQNLLTAPNTNHPNNSVWDPGADAARLAPFMSTPPAAPVGIGLALWPTQLVPAALTNGVPVRLSSFTTHPVSVDYSVATANGTLASGTLTFTPGETVKRITLPPASVTGVELVRVRLSQPTGGELTGPAELFLASAPQSATLIPFGSGWRYLDTGANLGTVWRAPGFNDSGWSNGLAQLGFQDGDERTVIRRTNLLGVIATFYFRKSINVPDPAQYGSFSLQLLRDDAGIVYFNGREVLRSPNMPPGEVPYNMFTGGSAPPDNTIDAVTLVNTGNVLSNGLNVVAVEIHQQSSTSSDVSFDLALAGNPLTTLRAARFDDELVLFWNEPSVHLEWSDTLPGTWTPMTEASPAVVPFTGPPRFFRLKGP